ncbi:Hsp70 family protein [Acinetobacter bereziniae]|uniref:Hsp70 family protein n=1 Tax=Acinetobacter bereziniae TaxID=106648 RepID=UPI00301A3D41
MTHKKVLVAIDLGTTNSLIGIFENGQTKLIENAYGTLTTPSAITLGKDQQILIGQAALELRHTGQQVLTSFKRFMGTNQTLKLGQNFFNAIELSALILGSLKKDAEHYLQQSVQDAVITVPAYFNDIQRQATVAAAELAGFEKINLINEPTAAALAYGLSQTDDSCFLVFDLGGGTFDVSIVEYFEGVIEVRASAGDNFLGGDDFVHLIMKQFWVAHGNTMMGEVQPMTPAIEIALRAKAQQVLHSLSKEQHTVLSFMWNEIQIEFTVSQQDLITWAEPLLQRLRRPLERALKDARIRPEQIDQVIMVGGATRIPMIRKLVTKLFGRFPSTSIQPDEAIVRGACVQAGLKSKDIALKEVVLTDVCPFSLGVEVGEFGQFSPIIERNTVIPTSRENFYSSLNPGQRKIFLKIYQGEHRLCKENIFLGEIEVLLPPNNECLSVQVRFSYNSNGILDVDVFVPSTNEKIQKVLINNQNTMTKEQIAESRELLALLKVHPRDKLINQSLVLRAERLYSEQRGELRQEIANQLEIFLYALESQEERRITEARSYLDKFLNQMDEQQFFDDY